MKSYGYVQFEFYAEFEFLANISVFNNNSIELLLIIRLFEFLIFFQKRHLF